MLALGAQGAGAANAIPAPAELPAERTIGAIEQVFAFRGAIPTGVSISEDGRIFVNFPQWGDQLPFPVGEIRDGQLHPYPDAASNQLDPHDPAKGFISVQSMVADGQTLYFCPLSSRHLYAVPTCLLRDPKVGEEELHQAIRDLGEKDASDGLEADANGSLYASDYEHNGIRQRLADGSWRTLVHDPQVLWPDTLSIGPDGYLYFIASPASTPARICAASPIACCA